MPRKLRAVDAEGPFSVYHYDSPREEIEAFYRRQQEDMQWRGLSAGLQRRTNFYNRLQGDQYEDPNSSFSENELSSQDESNCEGEESWRNADGERLEDFGVDEDIEFYDEDNIPLAELMERRRKKQL
jgi:palmitoyltransferase